MYQSTKPPFPVGDGDIWVDDKSNVWYFFAGAWLLKNSAYREEALTEDQIPESTPADYTLKDVFPDSKENAAEKFQVFEEVLANPEPIQRLGYPALTRAMLKKAVEDAMNSGTITFLRSI